MDAKRQRIVDSIIARMQLITVAGGYKTNLGNTVEDWRVDYDESELETGALSVCDLVENSTLAHDQPTADLQRNVLPVQLRIFTKATERASELRKMIADVNQAIRVDTRWGGLALWTLPKQSGMVIKPDEFKLGGAAVEIEITYLTETFNAET